jgi:hypothetical protein
MKRPVNKFLLKTLLFVIPVLVFFEVLFRLGFAPIVTNSTLFDTKMLNVQKHHIKNVTLLAAGSSETLYELNSKIIVQNFNIPYYNFSSWGMQVTDTKVLLKSLVQKYHPKYVIMCSSIGEFIYPQNDTYLNYINANNFIKDDFPELFYFKKYNSIHQVIRRKLTTYPLKLDDWGGTSLNIKPKDINQQKWNEHGIFPTGYTSQNYTALDSLGAYLAQQNIKFIFVQVPIKKSYTNTASSKQLILAHFDKCRAIVEKQGGIYLNYFNTTTFTDNLFTDQYHLQDTGAVILTKEIVADLKKIIR